MQSRSHEPNQCDEDSESEKVFDNNIFLNSRTYSFFCQILIVLLCFASYYHSLNGSFVFDDTVAIVKNKDVTTKPLNLTAIFTHDFWGTPISDNSSHKSYRPLTTLMFHWEFTNEFTPKQSKAINLLIHSINSILVWHLLRDLPFEEHLKINGEQIAIIASIIFSIHPIHVEPVAGIVGRADLMFCLLYLIALLLQKNVNHLGCLFVVPLIILLTSIGILFKETAITIPLACIFFYYMYDRIYTKCWRQQLKYITNINNFLYVITVIFVLWIRIWVQNYENPRFKPMDNPIASNDDSLIRLLSQHYLYVVNLWILLCPSWLSFDWALGCLDLVKTMWDLRLQAVLGFYSIVTLTILYFKTSFAPILSFGLMIIPFLPASGIITVGFVIAERVLYVPSIGYCLLVAYGFVYTHSFLGRNKWRQRQFKWILMLVLVSFLLRTRQRALDWQTEERLFASALKVCPKNAKVHYNIARLATDKFDTEKAFKHYHKAIELYPEYESALMNLGNLYREKGDYIKAEKYIKDSLQVLPDFATAWMNLGIVQSIQNKHTEALKSYETALKYRKNYGVLHYNMGNLYLNQEKYTEAMHHWQKSISINPRQPNAWANILTLLDNQGLHADVIRLSNIALEHLPNEMSLRFIRANVLGKLKHYMEAEKLYNQVITAEPMNMMYHTNLGVLYHRWGKYNEAIDSYRKAIDIDPLNAKTAHENLSKLSKRLREEQTVKQNSTNMN